MCCPLDSFFIPLPDAPPGRALRFGCRDEVQCRQLRSERGVRILKIESNVRMRSMMINDQVVLHAPRLRIKRIDLQQPWMLKYPAPSPYGNIKIKSAQHLTAACTAGSSRRSIVGRSE